MAAYYTETRPLQAHELLESVRPVTDLIEARSPFEEGVIELPQVYQTARQSGRQSDLIDLAVIVGAILQSANRHATKVHLVQPATWKGGQTPKNIQAKRTREILTTDELQRVSLPTAKRLHHNVWDAIGIGIWRWRTS